MHWWLNIILSSIRVCYTIVCHSTTLHLPWSKYTKLTVSETIKLQKLQLKSIKTKLPKNVIQDTYTFFLTYKKKEGERSRDEKGEMEKTDSQSPEKA